MARYNIQYDPQAIGELRELRRIDQVSILDAIERHLLHEPARVSRTTIKKLEPPVLAAFRLRVADYRVFYDVYENEQIVHIVAIRFKGRMTLSEAADGPSD